MTPISIRLFGYAARLTDPTHYPPNYCDPDGRGLLEHQVRTYAALAETALVMNAYPTGTGKTRAALLRLLHPDQQGQPVLLIAPTNALIEQHAADVRAFIAEQGLPFVVGVATAETIAARLDQGVWRRGTALHRMIENPADEAHDHGKPLVLVTNPDICYLALYYRYGQLDAANLFDDFLLRFTYIIIDEVHTYDSKQFASFLFLFGLLQAWGWLAAGRRLCLLSATPRPQVRQLLDRLFTTRGWQQITPATAPTTPAATTPALAPLDLHLVPAEQTIAEWVATEHARIDGWLSEQQDTVIISSSLVQINQIAATLLRHNPVRITGPEDAAERQRVALLTLATPTVDIGYNFGRPGKPRQSVDRLVCDARFRDDLLQRIGRAGRVLGRTTTDTPSEAWVLLDADVVAALQPYHGRELTRLAWNAIINGLDQQQFPARHQLDAYIRTHALLEVMYPIFKAAHMAVDREAEMAEMFEIVRAIFAPESTATRDRYIAQIRTYERRHKWLRCSPAERWNLTDRGQREGLATDIAALRNWQTLEPSKQHAHSASQFLGRLEQLATATEPGPQQFREQLAQYVAGCVALMDALLSFRDGAQGIAAAIFDPDHIFSTRRINQYDLLHLLRSYDLEWFASASEFAAVADAAAPAGTQVWVAVRGLLPPDMRRSIGFAWQAPWHVTSKSLFEAQYCRTVVPLHGLRLQLTERMSGRGFLLPEDVQAQVQAQHLPALLVPKEGLLFRSLLRRLRLTSFTAHPLSVTLPNADGAVFAYRVVLGTAAYHIEAELRGALHAHQHGLAADVPIFC
jgi:CRISPR-associated endonuclease/helicase Cas3